jgi:hypothetical protein
MVAPMISVPDPAASADAGAFLSHREHLPASISQRLQGRPREVLVGHEFHAVLMKYCLVGKLLRLFGGPGEIRTHDLFHAMEARSQLRHRPTNP